MLSNIDYYNVLRIKVVVEKCETFGFTVKADSDKNLETK
jgi:hypothetical protein